MPSDLEKLKQLTEELESTKRGVVDGLASDVKSVADALGIAASEIVAQLQSRFSGPSTTQEKRAAGKVALYKDPQNPANVWGGRGKKSAWLQEKLNDGAKLSDFLNPDHPDYENRKTNLEESEEEAPSG